MLFPAYMINESGFPLFLQAFGESTLAKMLSDNMAASERVCYEEMTNQQQRLARAVQDGSVKSVEQYSAALKSAREKFMQKAVGE